MALLAPSQGGLVARSARRSQRVKNCGVKVNRVPRVSVRAAATAQAPEQASASSTQGAPAFQRPDATGRFGRFGGRYVPETLIVALDELEREYEKAKQDPAFQVRACRADALPTRSRQRVYAARRTPHTQRVLSPPLFLSFSRQQQQ